MNQSNQIKGIDNVFFDVLNIDKALHFYQQLGFQQKLAIPQIKAVLLAIGNEEPGLILCEKPTIHPSKLWIEVESASQIKESSEKIGINGQIIHTATGLTFEILDEFGNTIGFADYSKKPELGRSYKKAIAKEYAERIWDKKDLTAIDDLLHKNIVIHSLLGDFYGLEAMRSIVQAWITGFPDLIVTNSAVTSEKDLVNIQWQAKGTHLGEFKGIKPTGKRISYAGVTIYRIPSDKITEYFAYLDMNHLFQQILND